MYNKINDLERRRIDRVFHTLESKGYEVLFYDWGINVRTPKKVSEIYLNDAGESRDVFLKNTAKHLAHRHNVDYRKAF